MNNSVAHYISELLFLHDCVIVPEFGGFVGNRKSAQLNKTTGRLTPPSKQILFNTSLKTNDGLLITHIADQEGTSQEMAKKNVSIFANESNSKLNTSKVLRIDKIGLFTLGKEENIIYLQDSSTNYSLDTFGMTTTYQKPKERITETEKQVDVTIKKIRNTGREPKVLLRAAAVIIPLVALSYLSISQQQRINNVYTQIATLNPFKTTEVVPEISAKISAKEPVINIAPEAIKIPIIEEATTPIIIKTNTYYIIAGAFAKQKNANKMLAKLNRWDYNAEIIEGRLLRVSYDSFKSRNEAIVALKKIKQTNPDAWLLTKE